MIKEELLGRMGLKQVHATCQLQQDSVCTIINLSDPDDTPITKVITERTFIPFTIDVTGEFSKKTDYIGEFRGYLCQYQPSFEAGNKTLTLEDIALQHSDAALYDFTSAVLGDKGRMPTRWCRPGEYFVLLTEYQTDPAFRGAGIGIHILDNLQKIINFECCIPIYCIFVPPPREEPLESDDGATNCERLKTSLRRLGFREIGHDGAGYFAQRVNPAY